MSLTIAGTITLGIDPGSRFTGYGIVQEIPGNFRCLGFGRIHAKSGDLPERLHHIYSELVTVINTYVPDEVAIEEVFFHVNAKSALTLGQARGAALVAAATLALPVSEYSPKSVKQSVIGYGAANKAQIQSMITTLLKLKETPESDAADALAIALCHAQQRRLQKKLKQAEYQS